MSSRTPVQSTVSSSNQQVKKPPAAVTSSPTPSVATTTKASGGKAASLPSATHVAFKIPPSQSAHPPSAPVPPAAQSSSQADKDGAKPRVRTKGFFKRAQTVVGLRANTAEACRLVEDKERTHNWKRWGPYLSERQWATVREDYSPDGSW